MRIVAFITDASTIRDVLVHRGNPAGRANVRSWQKRTSGPGPHADVGSTEKPPLATER